MQITSPNLVASPDLQPIAAGALARRSLVLAAGLGVAGLGGCTFSADADHTGPDAPRAVPLARPLGTAWVFSSGGPRGFVHVWVVQALDELGLVPDLLVGASVGALVAVLRAAGKSGSEIAQLALDLKPALLVRIALDGNAWLSAAPLADHSSANSKRSSPTSTTSPCRSRRAPLPVRSPFTRGGRRPSTDAR